MAQLNISDEDKLEIRRECLQHAVKLAEAAVPYLAERPSAQEVVDIAEGFWDFFDKESTGGQR